MAEPIPDVVFRDNTNERTPCVIVVDGSSSMMGESIEQLNEGLRTLETDLKSDTIASTRVQLLIIRAGDNDDATVLTDWTDAIQFTAPVVEANGTTPLGKAMDLALTKIEEQKSRYDDNGIPSTRPWIYLISDGEPNDRGWEKHAEICCLAEDQKKVSVFPIGTEDADLDKLSQFSRKGAKQLKGLQFKELFLWLSRSVSAASKATPGQAVQVPATDTWEVAST